MQEENSFSGQLFLIGTVVCNHNNEKVELGARCAMISVIDCDKLYKSGDLNQYLAQNGLDAGKLLDETLGEFGWSEIQVRNVLPVLENSEQWEPEIDALIKTASLLGFAHMVFEPISCQETKLH